MLLRYSTSSRLRRNQLRGTGVRRTNERRTSLRQAQDELTFNIQRRMWSRFAVNSDCVKRVALNQREAYSGKRDAWIGLGFFATLRMTDWIPAPCLRRDMLRGDDRGRGRDDPKKYRISNTECPMIKSRHHVKRGAKYEPRRAGMLFYLDSGSSPE